MAIITREEYKQLSNTTDTSLDSMIDLLIPVVEEDFLTIRGAPFEVDDQDQVAYPSGALLTAKLMLDWLLSPESRKALSGGKKSETIGKYSYSLQEIDGASGYPKAIIGRIETYVRGRV
jgi:hypothetical protein